MSAVERIREPTEQDRENAALRFAIAERQQQAWSEVYLLALNAFGPGWLPSCRHYLVEKEEEEKARRTGKPPKAAATVYTVKNEDGCKRHFTVENGKVVRHDDYKAGFGSMLFEPHPTDTIEVRGKQVHPHRYSLCFAPYDLYRPMTAEQLASLRASRERNRVERERQKWREANPLLAWAEEQNPDTGGSPAAESSRDQ